MEWILLALAVLAAALALFAGGDNDPDWYDNEGYVK